MRERKILRKDVDVKEINDVIEEFGPAAVLEAIAEYIDARPVNYYPWPYGLKDVDRKKAIKKVYNVAYFVGKATETGAFTDEEFASVKSNPIDWAREFIS